MSDSQYTKNTVGRNLKILSVVILILGGIAGLIFAILLQSFLIYIYFLVGSFITSMFFAGFSEIINLLQELVNIENFSAPKIASFERDVINRDSSNPYDKITKE